MQRAFVLCCLAGSILGLNLRGQIITTAAGATTIFSDSTQAVLAPLGTTLAVALDASGNVYAADSSNNTVVRLSPDGTLTIVAGNGGTGFSGDGGPATRASLNAPGGVALDSSGNLYIADQLNSRIRKVGTDGVITTVAGTGAQGFSGDGGPAANAELFYPNGLAIDKSGNLLIADALNSRVRRITPGGIISSVVGSGIKGFGGDGGPATSAQLNNPIAVAVDAGGNILVSDSGNNRIRRIATDGTISTVAGNGTAAFSGDGGPATAASLNNPHGIAADSAGNIYIADPANYRVRKVAASGIISTITGTGVEGFSGDGGPASAAAVNFAYGVAVDAAGNVFIADTNNNRIRRIAPAGNIATVAGNGGPFSGDGGPGTGALLNSPSCVAADAAGTIYIADTKNNRIRKLSPDRTITTIAGSPVEGFGGDGGPATSASLDYPYSIALDSAGNLYIADAHNNRIREVTAGGVIKTIAGSGKAGYSGDGGPALSASFATPRGVAVDGAGNVYIADTFNHSIREVLTNGTIRTVAGTGSAGFAGDGGPANKAMLNTPLGVAVDPTGNVYVADTLNSRVRRITADGVINTIAGNGQTGFVTDGVAATSASLFYPTSLTFDSTGALYIADTYDSRIRKVTSGGAISTVVGNGFATFSGDGGAATNAALSYPAAVAFDAAGNLYIADTGNSRIREVLGPATTVSYQANPASLNFAANSGGAPTGAQTVSIVSGVSGLGFSLSANAPWLSLSTSSGFVPATIQVTADPAGMAAGSYPATLTVTLPNATPSTAKIPVTFTVAPATQPALSVNAANLAFAGFQGGASSSQQLQVANSGSGTLAFTARATGSWLSVSPGNGAATPASPASLTVTANIGSLTPGTYNGAINVTAGGNSTTVPVTLSVAPPAAVIVLSQSALAFQAVAQGGVPLPQSFGILNSGQGAMTWTAAPSTTAGGNWLQIFPTTGTVQRPYLDVSLVSVGVNAAGLAAGTYYGQIGVTSLAGNSPQILTVALTVLPAGSTPAPQVQPTGLIFTGVAGANPGSQDVLVGNPKSQPDNFLSGSIGRGFSYSPANSSVLPGQPATVRVYPDFTSLSPGDIQRGTITLQFSDGTPVTIRVLSVVAPAADGGTGSIPPRAASCPSPSLEIQFRTLQPNFVAVVSQGTTVEVQVVDDCGNAMVSGGSAGTGAQVAFSNGDAHVNLTHIGNGVWSGTWRPVHATSSAVTLTVTAFEIDGSSAKANQVALTGTVRTGGAPIVTAGGVVQAASFAAGVPIAPGGLITIYGSNLANGSGAAGTVPLPRQLNGTQVLMGSETLPLLYTSDGQMNVQVPFDVPVNTQFQMTVQKDNLLSVPESLVVAAAQPGIFTANQQGTGQGVILKSDQVTQAQPGTPAAIGEAIVIYCTGLGPVSPTVTAGQPAPQSPLSSIANTLTLTIGGQPAQILFAGLTPGFAGLYQINAVVPSGVTPGDAVPVVVQVAGQTSLPVTMSIQ